MHSNENYDGKINENLFYSFINQVLQFNKNFNYKFFKNIKDINIDLVDLKSRLNSFLEIPINLPTDDL